MGLALIMVPEHCFSNKSLPNRDAPCTFLYLLFPGEKSRKPRHINDAG